MDPITERCLDWSFDSVAYDAGECSLRVQLTRYAWDGPEDAPPEWRCTMLFANIQSCAIVDGAWLSHYWDNGDYQPLLQMMPHSPEATHLGDHKVFEDHHDQAFKRYRLTAGDDTVEVLTRDSDSFRCEFEEM